jgi:octaprenyl-diphosphate synthase
MSQLTEIKQSIKAEFAVFEKIYFESLQSDNVLLSHIFSYVLSTKGKQIRPILLLLSAKLCGGITETTYSSALCVELLHATSLIHDDVVDSALLRRGNPSVNAEFGNKIAVLGGDYLLSKVFSIAGKMKDERLIDAFSNLGKALAEGELLQLKVADDPQFDEEIYLEIIRKKTAILFSSCMFAGAVSSAKASDEQTEKLYQYGELLGLCFQIKDDIFDYSNNKEIGKPTANDIREKKITLPLIAAYQKASEAEKVKAHQLLKQKNLSAEDIVFFLHLTEKYKGIEQAEAVMRNYVERAKTLLNDFSNQEIKAALCRMIDYVVMRKK